MQQDLIDISQPPSAGRPSWHGDTRFPPETVWRIGPDRPVTVSRFGCSTHAGTHADPPSHHGDDGDDELIALPPRQVGPDASPVRAVMRPFSW